MIKMGLLMTTETATTPSHGVDAGLPPMDMATARRWVLGLAAFAVVAAAGLLLPIGALGWRVLALVVLFHLGTVVLARRTGDELLWRSWCVLAPLSVLMVLPDWYLSAEVGSLNFPDTGAPFIGTVPLFMAGMWTIALLPLILVGFWVAGRGSGSMDANRVAVGAAAAGVAGLIMFWGAELVAPIIPLWEPVGVPMVAGVAAYVVLPEIVLSAAAFVVVATAGRVPTLATASLTALLPFTYTGMLATSYQFLG